MSTGTAAEPKYAFARHYRLTKTDEFSSVFGFKRAIRGQLLMLHYRPREEGATAARLGLVVGKKFLKSAVHRNLLKRLTREQFRRLRPGLPPYDLIVRLIAKPGRLDRRGVAAEVGGLLGKLASRTARAEAAKTE